MIDEFHGFVLAFIHGAGIGTLGQLDMNIDIGSVVIIKSRCARHRGREIEE